MSKMPELPEPGFTLEVIGQPTEHYYTAEQMHDYARAYAESEAGRLREALEEVLAHHANDNNRPRAFYIAAAALAPKEK